MNANEINAYLQRAREIIGERSPGEIAYDNSVVTNLRRGMDIKRAIQSANHEHPEEALNPLPDQWPDLASRYDYMVEHKAILEKLGIKE
ncbi:hypothetical protein SBV1_230016 [Verrucomicrobia bacterium]|nr:hypothetical protein SBV1_230016 [Verrucomicrobiota bacterium]